MRFPFPARILLLSLMLAACSTSVIDNDQRMLPEGQDPFTGTTMEVDLSRSFVAFEGRSSIVNHEGKFNTFMVDITPDPVMPEDATKATVNVVIDVTSVETDAEGLTRHLLAEDFFDAANHPVATFTSSSVLSTGGNTYQVGGTMTIKGVSLQATFDVVLTDEMLIARYGLPRRVFGIGNDTYGDKVLDPIVPLEIQLVFRR